MRSKRVLIPLLIPSIVTLTLLTTITTPAAQTRMRWKTSHNGMNQPRSVDANSEVEREKELVKGSRESIIEMGVSESYFKSHFRLVKVFDRPGDERVVWKLSVGAYEATVNDAIGFYTDTNGKRVYSHSIKSILGKIRDINKTISKARSAALMRACVGRYTAASVVLMRLTPSETSSLFLTAHSQSRSLLRDERRERPSAASEKSNNQQIDQPESEGTDKHPQARIGYVNLETGRCTKGLAIVTP